MCEPKKKKQPEDVAPQKNPTPAVKEEKKEVEPIPVVEAKPAEIVEEKEEVEETKPAAEPTAEPEEKKEEEPMVQIQESLYISVCSVGDPHR